MSVTPRRVISTVTSSFTSWRQSRSPLTMITWWPASRPRRARVARRSSASYPSSSTTGRHSASSTSRMSGNCPRRVWGVSSRPALYAGYWSSRNCGSPLSMHAITASGRSSLSSLKSIEVNPNTALVTCPELVTRVSGRAKKARNASE